MFDRQSTGVKSRRENMLTVFNNKMFEIKVDGERRVNAKWNDKGPEYCRL